MNRVKIFLSHLCVLPFFPPCRFPMKIFGLHILSAVFIARYVSRLAKEAEYDGVEFFCSDSRLLNRMVAIAKEHGLEAHVHQVWSLKGSHAHLHNIIFGMMGMLAPSHWPLRKHFAGVTAPSVVYASYWEEALGHKNYWLQTAAETSHGKLKITWEEFVTAQQKYNLPVVLDTIHLLELMVGNPSVQFFPKDKRILREMFKSAWDQLGPMVKEIHLSDCVPGGDNTTERNLVPGKGKLPLAYFLSLVKDSGWGGVITPEVRLPLSLIFRPNRMRKYARMLRETTLTLWKDQN